MQQKEIVLYLDDSKCSREVYQLLQESGLKFEEYRVKGMRSGIPPTVRIGNQSYSNMTSDYMTELIDQEKRRLKMAA